MGIKTVKYGMKYGPWRFRHYVIGITLQRLNTTVNLKEQSSRYSSVLILLLLEYDIHGAPDKTSFSIRNKISGILDPFN